MANWICEHIPNNIETYVEVFGGAFWVYIKGDIHKKPKLKEVVYNDKNRFMANLFKCLRNPDVMLSSLQEHESQDEKLFIFFQDYLNSIVNNKIEYPLGTYPLAVRYAYLATQVFSGSKILESKFIDLKGKYGSKYDAFIRRLSKPDIKKRLSKITEVENRDYHEIINIYDSPTTFFYADPPYYNKEDYYSGKGFSKSDHELLCKMLGKIDGLFALSYYEFEELSEWLPKEDFNWVEKQFTKASGAQKGKKQNKGTELLIMNY